MEASKTQRSQGVSTAEQALKRMPFDFGIKELKRVLSRMDMPKAEKNRTVRLYKERLYTRVEEVRAKMEEKLQMPEGEASVGEANGVKATKETKHATDK